MALIRILIDGYSLLHAWPEVAPGKARHSAAAREDLLHILTQYRDSIGTPITVVFDGAGAPPGTPKLPTSPEMEILFSSEGKTADDLIERAAFRLKDYGEILVVTDDSAERETILSLGANACSCWNFINLVESALSELRQDIKLYNRREMNRYKQSGNCP